MFQEIVFDPSLNTQCSFISFQKEINAILGDEKFIKNQIVNFPSTIDFQGSIKALFMLHYSYAIDLTSAVQLGTLSFVNHNGQQKNYHVSKENVNEKSII